MSAKNNPAQFCYLGGDKAKYTGKSMTLHGGLFYEVKMVEGHMKGQIKVTVQAPAISKAQAEEVAMAIVQNEGRTAAELTDAQICGYLVDKGHEDSPKNVKQVRNA
jgi:hypothetical protein